MCKSPRGKYISILFCKSRAYALLDVRLILGCGVKVVDKKLGISHNYFGSSNTGAAPMNKYSLLKIHAMKAADAELLVDNLYAASENKAYVEESIGSTLAK